MAAVSTNQIIKAQEPGSLQKAPVAASTHLYQGTITFWERTSGDAEGYILADDDNGTNNFAGILRKEVDNSSGSAGDLNGEVYQEGVFELQGSGFTQAIVGDAAYAIDNITVQASSTNASLIGRFVEYVSASRMRVRIDIQQT